MINDRRSQILQAVVKEYVRYARPVSSASITRRYRLGVSPATVRNEFTELTEKGYLFQPHTSAGRAPTQRGYRFYVNTKVFGPASKETLEEEDIPANSVHEFAESLAGLSRLMAAVWREDGDFMMHGIKQLLSQPEFSSRETSLNVCELMDAMPDIIERFFSMDSPAGIFIGNECPLWEDETASVVFRKFRMPDKSRGVAVVLGPTRMAYESIWELLNRD